MGIWDERGGPDDALVEGAPRTSPQERPAMADLTLLMLDDAALYLLDHEPRASDPTSGRIALQTSDGWMRLRRFDARSVGTGSGVAPAETSPALLAAGTT